MKSSWDCLVLLISVHTTRFGCCYLFYVHRVHDILSYYSAILSISWMFNQNWNRATLSARTWPLDIIFYSGDIFIVLSWPSNCRKPSSRSCNYYCYWSPCYKYLYARERILAKNHYPILKQGFHGQKPHLQYNTFTTRRYVRFRVAYICENTVRRWTLFPRGYFRICDYCKILIAKYQHKYWTSCARVRGIR